MPQAKKLTNKKYQNIFQAIIKKQNLTHSYIFSGTIGSFIKNTASDFLKSLNCLNFEQEPCNECQSCLKHEKENAVDFYSIEPEGKITINLIRELQDFIKYGPLESKFLTVLINNTHLFTEEAANAFLKTLEEPPAKVIFVLLTPNLLDLLPTIRSRSQIFEFPVISDADFNLYLQQISNIEKKGLTTKTFNSVELQKYYLDNSSLVLDLSYISFQEFLQKSKIEKLSFAYELSTKNKEQIKLFLVLWLKELLEENNPFMKNKKTAAEKIIENILQMKYNLNLRLSLENLFIQISI